jgi:hypothetical protein
MGNKTGSLFKTTESACALRKRKRCESQRNEEEEGYKDHGFVITFNGRRTFVNPSRGSYEILGNNFAIDERGVYFRGVLLTCQTEPEPLYETPFQEL